MRINTKSPAYDGLLFNKIPKNSKPKAKKAKTDYVDSIIYGLNVGIFVELFLSLLN